MALVKNEHRYTVDGWMINDLKLQGIELQVYAIIYGFSQGDQGVFFGSTSYIAEFIGTTRQRAARTLDALCEKGYIKKQERKGKSNYYSVNSKLIDEMRNNNNSHLLHSVTTPVTQHNNSPVTPCNNTCYTALHEIESNSKSMNKEIKKERKRTRTQKQYAAIPTDEELQQRFDLSVANEMSDWFKYKAERNEKYGETALKKLLTQVENNCSKYGSKKVSEIISLSMSRNWQGIAWERLEEKQEEKKSSLGYNFVN